MCGIAGFFSRQPFDSALLDFSSKSLQHRGPDGEGFSMMDEQGAMKAFYGRATRENCRSSRFGWLPQHEWTHWPQTHGGFIHRRLAIIAPDEGGHQPQSDQSGRFWITYNGEIYNYLELRKELEQFGYAFFTGSDTEVILAAYAHWGPECLQRFNGMWAFAIYDSLEQTLFAARDRFGVKPFYYVKQTGRFAFASEYRVLTGSGWATKKLNPRAVFDYFVFSEIEYEAEGFFTDIAELAPAHYLQYNLKTEQLNTCKYYSLSFTADRAPFSMRADEVQERTLFELERAVKLRLRADVEVGSCLSGGLDSSAIVALMHKNLPSGHPLHVYTAIFPGSSIDESAYAAEMARSVEAIQHTVQPDANSLWASLNEFSAALDLPIWSTSTFAQYRVMQKVSETGLKVVLDGQGGDELFAGYPYHHYFFRKGAPYLSAEEAKLLGGRKFQFHQWLRYEGIFKAGNFAASRFYRHYFPGLKYLRDDFYKAHVERFSHPAERRWPDLNSRLAWEMQNTTLKAYLRCEDRCSMHFGVESRTPFADDHLLAEWALSIPGRFKIKDGVGKVVLREALKGLMPENVRLRRDKKGYSTPNNSWIRELAPALPTIFEGGNWEEFIDKPRLISDLRHFFNPSHDVDDGRIFKFISFVSWMNGLNNSDFFPKP